MTDYAKVLTFNYPGKVWTLEGDSYEGLTWLDSSAKPTQAELDSQWQPLLDKLAAEEQAQANAKASALAKLTALGLTQAEITALIG